MEKSKWNDSHTQTPKQNRKMKMKNSQEQETSIPRREYLVVKVVHQCLLSSHRIHIKRTVKSMYRRKDFANFVNNNIQLKSKAKCIYFGTKIFFSNEIRLLCRVKYNFRVNAIRQLENDTFLSFWPINQEMWFFTSNIPQQILLRSNVKITTKIQMLCTNLKAQNETKKQIKNHSQSQSGKHKDG